MTTSSTPHGARRARTSSSTRRPDMVVSSNGTATMPSEPTAATCSGNTSGDHGAGHLVPICSTIGLAPWQSVAVAAQSNRS